jgi:hypothetical protein
MRSRGVDSIQLELGYKTMPAITFCPQLTSFVPVKVVVNKERERNNLFITKTCDNGINVNHSKATAAAATIGATVTKAAAGPAAAAPGVLVASGAVKEFTPPVTVN